MFKSRTFVWWLATSVTLLYTAASQPELQVATWQKCSGSVEHPMPLLTDAPDPGVGILILSWCGITELKPGDFNNAPNVEVVDLEGNNISDLPANIFNYPKLQKVTLFNANVLGEHISPKAFASTSLKNINLGGNNMTNAPNDLLENTPNLEEISLNFASLTEIPAFLRKVSLPHLVSIYLRFNDINIIDSTQTLTKAPNLQNIDLAYSKIEYISEDFFKPFNALTEVYLQKNRLTNLPEKIFKNKIFLSKVNLANNHLEYIPKTAFEGTSLTSLDLTNNKLTFMPDNILSIRGSKLTKFNFLGNQWRCADLKIIITVVENKNIQHNSYLNDEMCYKLVKYIDEYKRREYDPFSNNNFS